MNWLIATDLDGTLLDDDYDLVAAAAALDRQAALGHEIALASSKTFSEMLKLASLCGRSPTLIFENGAGIAWPERLWRKTEAGPVRHGFRVQLQGESYIRLRAMLRALRRSSGARYQGFADMSVAQIAELTGLSTSGAALARERQASEPLRWLDTPEALQQFEQALQQRGYRLVKGGRFHHVMPRTDKACAVSALARRLAEKHAARVSVLCCGDIANDLAMLCGADVAVVFPRPDGSVLALERDGSTDRDGSTGASVPAMVLHAAAAGADAWTQAVSGALGRCGSAETRAPGGSAHE